MVLEIATITVEVSRLQEFETAFVEARKVITKAEGCGALSLQRCIETPGRYQLFVEWASVKHHNEGFRGSEAFKEWRRIIGPFFANPPLVEHYVPAG
jgi:heme-degrading monooxygenase HmoA